MGKQFSCWNFLIILSGLTARGNSEVKLQKDLVNPHHFTYHLNNENRCENDTDVLIWIHSAPDHFRNRRIIRDTWANPANFRLHKAALIFFLGLTNKPDIQSMISYESETYQDIAQSTYIDDYRNLTYKAISGCKWMSLYCKQAKLVLKADDDMTTDVYLLFNHIHSLQQRGRVLTNTILCDVWQNRWPERKSGKWKVSTKEYAESSYPTYCPGLGLIMTGDLPPKLFMASIFQKYFWIDDVYFTGLLARTVNATFERLGAAVHFGSAKKIKTQTMLKNPYMWVFYHVHERPSMEIIWEMVQAREIKRVKNGIPSYA